MKRVEHKIALVTGAASGLGRAIAKRLAEEGAQVIISDINGIQGQVVAEDIGARFVSQDVCDEARWQKLLASIQVEHGGLDILVNNAGISRDVRQCTPELTQLDEWRKLHKVNAESVFLGCKYALPIMSASGGGSIVNLSSIAAMVATPFISAYGGSKASVMQLSTSVAMHGATTGALKGNHVRCNSVHPGQIRTPMLETLFEQTAELMAVDAEQVEAQFLSRIPMGKFGEPEDIANMVLFLASDEAKFVTGGQFAVDGGFQLNG